MQLFLENCTVKGLQNEMTCIVESLGLKAGANEEIADENDLYTSHNYIITDLLCIKRP